MSDDSNSLVLVNGVPVSGPEEITAVQVVHHKNNGESEAVQNITTSSDEDSVKASFRKIPSKLHSVQSHCRTGFLAQTALIRHPER